RKKKNPFTDKKWFQFLGSGELPIRNLAPKVLFASIFLFGLTLFTNQYFHGGVFGTLHNKSVKPKVEISNIQIMENQISLELYRVEGADVYGSFLIGIEIRDENQNLLKSLGQKELSEYPI